MKRHDPLDATTMGPSQRAADLVPHATVRFVFRGGEGVVDEPARRLAAGLTLVGRGCEEGLALGIDPRASRRHAELHYQPRDSELVAVDLGSRNGIHVNGRPVARATLQDGDVVRFGTSFAVVRFEDPRQLDAPVPTLAGSAPSMQRLRVAVHRAAPRQSSALICGETGVGKELVARALHEISRRPGPFVPVNCTAIGEGVADSQLFGHVAGAFTGAVGAHDGFFRAARGGTLFLDEIGDMALSIQPKLLRALETGEVVPLGATAHAPFDARVVAATNADLDAAVAEGRFRADLYARLAQIVLKIEPLRRRREDILMLLQSHLGAAPPLAPDLVEALLTAGWPRNVREIIAIATQLSMWGEGRERLELELVRDVLPPSEAVPDTEPDDVNSDAPRERGIPEKEELEQLLRAHGGNIAAVAKQVGRSRAQVYRWMERYGLDLEGFR